MQADYNMPFIIDKEKHKNWLRAIYGLKCLKKYVDVFVDQEAEKFHSVLKEAVQLDLLCSKSCSFAKKNGKNQTPKPLCEEVCAVWKEKILANHGNLGGKVYLHNSNPPLWAINKWEVVKVFMPDGQKSKNKLCHFDIVALLVFINHCKHFEEYRLKGCCEKIVNVRNEIMHSPNYELEQEELHEYLGRIKVLGKKLEEKVPEFKELSKDIEGIQNTDFTLVFPAVMEAQQLYEAAMQDGEYCTTPHLLNTMREKLTEEDIEYLLFAAVQKASVEGRSEESLRREEMLLRERLAELEKERDNLYQAAAQGTLDRTMGSFRVNMMSLLEKIDELKNKSKNLQHGISEDGKSQASHCMAQATQNQETSAVDKKIIDIFAKLYVCSESIYKTLESEEEDEDEKEEEEEPKKKNQLPNIFSMAIASAMAIAKIIVEDDDNDDDDDD
ncbi:hypothetical protein LDENG_00079960 [Lucifuga dentata]|nr:hypothetical protein LDENG_00079960 [Lucifuga dentata]